jgi:hypothetical protein
LLKDQPFAITRCAPSTRLHFHVPGLTHICVTCWEDELSQQTSFPSKTWRFLSLGSIFRCSEICLKRYELHRSSRADVIGKGDLTRCSVSTWCQTFCNDARLQGLTGLQHLTLHILRSRFFKLPCQAWRRSLTGSLKTLRFDIPIPPSSPRIEE